MNVETYIVLNSEVCISIQFKKHFNQLYQIRYINKKISVYAFRLGYKWLNIYKAVSYDV